MLVDAARIHIRSGKGGDGAVSFRRQKYIPKGGPDGGDGGNGGDVILLADPEVATLLDFAGRHHWHAENGGPGQAKQKHGKHGQDRIILLPTGTLVHDDATGELIVDLNTPGQRFVAAKGGRGGFGNEHYATPTHQTPREATPGEPGTQRDLRLELKLIADVGLIGKPNAGKSTLLSVVSRARPKIADYPFTTLEPNLGIAETPAGTRLVLADIPGLIEGAHAGSGLGTRFLRHIERTRTLLHLLEAAPADESRPADNYRAIRHELAAYSPELAAKPEVVALSKIELLGDEEEQRAAVAELERELGQPVLPFSSVTRQGLPDLLRTLAAQASDTDEPPAETKGWSTDA